MTRAALLLAVLLGAAPQPHPETVVVSYHVKHGQEKALEQVLREAWTTMRTLDLVLESPHAIVASDALYVEVFTWKDSDTPDHAPPAVQKLWKRMNQLARIEILEGRLVTP